MLQKFIPLQNLDLNKALETIKKKLVSDSDRYEGGRQKRVMTFLFNFYIILLSVMLYELII